MHQAAALDAIVAGIWAIAKKIGAPLPEPVDALGLDWMDEIEQLVLFDAQREETRRREFERR